MALQVIAGCGVDPLITPAPGWHPGLRGGSPDRFNPTMTGKFENLALRETWERREGGIAPTQAPSFVRPWPPPRRPDVQGLPWIS